MVLATIYTMVGNYALWPVGDVLGRCVYVIFMTWQEECLCGMAIVIFHRMTICVGDLLISYPIVW